MSKYPTPLHKLAHTRMEEVFGPPENTLGRDDHWSLKPWPNSISINVLVNGAGDKPAIWVFDPFSKNDGVLKKSIADEDELSQVIKQIQRRLQSATETRKPQGEL